MPRFLLLYEFLSTMRDIVYLKEKRQKLNFVAFLYYISFLKFSILNSIFSLRSIYF